MKSIFIIPIIFLLGCKSQVKDKSHVIESDDTIIASGQMPSIAFDKEDQVHMVFGSGDSILHAVSADHGQTFSQASLVSTLPRLAASHTRGPQVAVSSTGLLVTACNAQGDIFSFVKEAKGQWQPSGKVNDVDTTAKENLMALSSDGPNAFAVWLDLRDKHNKIFGSRSVDGGKTWSKNILVYASPDTTVCECCKPSVVVKGNDVHVMFRNWLGGNRDMYLVQSSDGGERFGDAQKLGNGSWPLKGCPMDGGGIAISNDQTPETVWRRQGKIFSCKAGSEEKEIGEGKSCTIESAGGKNIYAWVENGNVVVLNTKGEKKIVGKGMLPVIKAIDNDHVMCVWEKDKKIHKAILSL